MDKNQLISAGMVYGFAVLLPTVHLFFADQGWDHPFLERVVVGIVGVLAGRWVWQAVRGERQPDGTQKYWGFGPAFFVAGLVVIYLAWFTNLPQGLVGGLKGTGVAVSPANVIPLDALWPRVATSILTMLGVWLLSKGVRTTVPPFERNQVRLQKAEAKRVKRAKYELNMQQ